MAGSEQVGELGQKTTYRLNQGESRKTGYQSAFHFNELVTGRSIKRSEGEVKKEE